MFALTREEIMRISQFVISSDLKFSKNVYAFTQEGVAMLSGVLRSARAVQVNIAIMRAFVRLREVMATSKELARKLAELEKHIASYEESIRTLFQAIRELMTRPEPPRKRIGFQVKEKHPRYAAKPKKNMEKEGTWLKIITFHLNGRRPHYGPALCRRKYPGA